MNATTAYHAPSATPRMRRLPRLGIIWPDTGEAHHLFEMASAQRLRAAIRDHRLEVGLGYSSGPGGHSVAALQQVGEIESIARAGTRLIADGADALVWACTSGSFIGGLKWSRDQHRALQDRLERPVTTGTQALIASAERLKLGKIDLLSPYPEDVSAILRSVMQDAGFDIGALHPLHSPGATASAALPLVEECARLADARGEAVVIPDTAANTLEIIDLLEEAAGKPVLTVNQACVIEQDHFIFASERPALR